MGSRCTPWQPRITLAWPHQQSLHLRAKPPDKRHPERGVVQGEINNMVFYIVLHALFGVVAGATLVDLKYGRQAGRARVWFVYLAGVGICFGIAALIGELSRQWQVEDLYKWLGAGVVLFSFLGSVWIGAKFPKSKKDKNAPRSD